MSGSGPLTPWPDYMGRSVTRNIFAPARVAQGKFSTIFSSAAGGEPHHRRREEQPRRRLRNGRQKRPNISLTKLARVGHHFVQTSAVGRGGAVAAKPLHRPA